MVMNPGELHFDPGAAMGQKSQQDAESISPMGGNMVNTKDHTAGVASGAGADLAASGVSIDSGSPGQSGTQLALLMARMNQPESGPSR